MKIHFDKSQITSLRELIFVMYDNKICLEKLIMTNLENTFFVDKEIQDIMIEFYLIKKIF